MGSILLQPQEIEVYYIMPALRRNLAINMKNNGMKQKEIAELFSIDKAAVSQYLSGKRGNKISFDDSIQKEIKKSASLIKDKLSYLREMQRLLRIIRNTKIMCKLHKQFSDIPKECCPELIKCFGGRKHGDEKLQD
ncbi:transcriptional regulator [Candidatus Woesearchaeota archaeon]|nr:MAG: transcriptional regulator [Candidatus Woesearchaeota archaeon]